MHAAHHEELYSCQGIAMPRHILVPVYNLQAETDYCYNVLEDTEQLQEQLYREMRGRIQEADQSAPVRSAEHSDGVDMLMACCTSTCCHANRNAAFAGMVLSIIIAALSKASSTAYTAEGSCHPKLLPHQVCSRQCHSCLRSQ